MHASRNVCKCSKLPLQLNKFDLQGAGLLLWRGTPEPGREVERWPSAVKTGGSRGYICSCFSCKVCRRRRRWRARPGLVDPSSSISTTSARAVIPRKELRLSHRAKAGKVKYQPKYVEGSETDMKVDATRAEEMFEKSKVQMPFGPCTSNHFRQQSHHELLSTSSDCWRFISALCAHR
jgi:hypothetical protein